MKLSIIIPVYNEVDTILTVLDQVRKVELQRGIEKEIIIVDDGSKDGTRDKLKEISSSIAKVILHEKNQGKGAAVRTGIKYTTGDFLIIQDGDLEYDPKDYPLLLQPLLDGKANVVFGCRYTKTNKSGYTLFYVGNALVSFFASIIYFTWIRDIETGYKLFKSDIIKNLHLTADGFEIEPEITAKVLRSKQKILELPINYRGRTYSEGKKITVCDGIKAIYFLLKYRFNQ